MATVGGGITAISISGNVMGENDVITSGTVVSDVGGEPIGVATLIQGDYGNLIIGSDGAYTYMPTTDIGFIDQIDEFEYTIDDGNGYTDTATLSVTIESSPELPDTSLSISDEGFDILSFDSADQTISLSDIFEVDVIDLSGIGANTLMVKAEELTSSDATYIRGDNDDTVDLGNIGADLSDTDGSGNAATWVNTQTTTTDADGEQYNVWALSTDSATEVNIDVDITNVI